MEILAIPQTALKRTFWRWQITRIVFTFVVLRKIVWILRKYKRLDVDDQIGRRRLEFTQNVLFGDRSVAGHLFSLWVVTLVAAITLPLWGPILQPIIEKILS